MEKRSMAELKVLSIHGRPVKEDNLEDYPRNLDQVASFDKQCRKFQYEADLASVQEDMLLTKQQEMKKLVKEQPGRKIESGAVDSVVKSQRRRKKKNQNVYQPSDHLNSSVNPRQNSASARVPRNTLTVAAILGEVSDEINTQPVQMSAKAFADKMFIEREFVHEEGFSSEFKPFSSSLEVLNSNKHFFMKPNSRPANEIVIMKPVVPRSTKSSENVICYCSSMQSHPKLGEKVKAKPTSFSFREMKRKLKHTFKGSRNERNKFSVDGCIYRGVDTRESFSSSADVACGTANAREKLDLPRQDFDVILEAKRHLSERFKVQNEIDITTSKRSPSTLERILSSPEHDCWPLSPKRDWYGYLNERKMTYLHSPRSIKEVPSFGDYKEHDNDLENFGTRKVSSPFQSTDEAAQNSFTSQTEKTKSSNGESEILETTSIEQLDFRTTEVSFGGRINYALDPISANETNKSTSDASESPTSSICRLDVADSRKDQEHRSPVSVLELFFTEAENSPPSAEHQTGQFAERRSLKTLRLNFDECLYEAQPLSKAPCINVDDCIFLYVHLVLEASRLNWNQLSQIISQPEEILHESLFDEVEFLHDDSLFDYKLLFDHINEVLVQIYECHCCCSWMRSIKPEIRYLPLENIVLDIIMKDADLFLYPRDDKRTLDQIVSKDVASTQSWLNVRTETEKIVFDISEGVMEDLILDMLLDFLK